MNSTPSAWPSQLRLRGQAAAPEGPVDMTAMYVMHHGFRRDLDVFVPAVRQTPIGDRGAWRALAERWESFGALLSHHHHGEDTGVWPVLRRRVGPTERSVLEVMETEHDAIDPLLEACRQGFSRLAESADADARAALAVRLVAAREQLRLHLTHEEVGAVPLIQQYFSPEEWRHIEEEHFRRGLGLSQLAALVPWAVQGLPREVRGRVMLSAGVRFRLVYRTTRHGFARRERRAFRYVRDG